MGEFEDAFSCGVLSATGIPRGSPQAGQLAVESKACSPQAEHLVDGDLEGVVSIGTGAVEATKGASTVASVAAFADKEGGGIGPNEEEAATGSS